MKHLIETHLENKLKNYAITCDVVEGEETAALSFFYEFIPLEVKWQIVKALRKKATKYPEKRLDDKVIGRKINIIYKKCIK